jgi:hypothetical protein
VDLVVMVELVELEVQVEVQLELLVVMVDLVEPVLLEV